MEEQKQFRCLRCGNCCRWPGCVRISGAEADAIAAYLGVPVGEFLDRYTALMPDRQGLTLIEQVSGSCIFLEECEPPACRIDPVKPSQCRRFPEHWNFSGWEKECAGGAALSKGETEK